MTYLFTPPPQPNPCCIWLYIPVWNYSIDWWNCRLWSSSWVSGDNGRRIMHQLGTENHWKIVSRLHSESFHLGNICGPHCANLFYFLFFFWSFRNACYRCWMFDVMLTSSSFRAFCVAYFAFTLKTGFLSPCHLTFPSEAGAFAIHFLQAPIFIRIYM